MIKIGTYIALILILMVSCKSVENTQQIKNQNINSKVILSIPAKLFYEKLRNEIKNELSQEFITDYRLQLIQGIYYLIANIKVSEDLTNSLEKMNVIIELKEPPIWKIKIPVNQFENLIQLNGIDFLDTEE